MIDHLFHALVNVIEAVATHDHGEGLMVRKFGIVWLFGLALMSGTSSASAFGPVNSVGPSVKTQRDLLDASFFGRPFPYGYTGWGPCMRYVEVQTRWGLRLRRVWVCR
jgi:hypothetical protein